VLLLVFACREKGQFPPLLTPSSSKDAARRQRGHGCALRSDGEQRDGGLAPPLVQADRDVAGFTVAAEGEMFIQTSPGARGTPLTRDFEVCLRYKWLQADLFYVSSSVLSKSSLEMSSAAESLALPRRP